MKPQPTTLPEIKLVGITARTNNQNERNWQEGKIFPRVQEYFHQATADKIPNRKSPGVTYCVYTDYESDHTGDYTYLIGEEVTTFDGLPEGLETWTIAPQSYAKFTNGPGAMPDVVREPWEKIWTMTPQDFGGERRYHADFEVYDERAADHENIVFDIYIGLQK